MTEILTVKGRPQTLSHVLWKRYGRRILGFVEATYTQNQGLANLGPILPIGTEVVVTPPAPKPKVRAIKLIRLTGG